MPFFRFLQALLRPFGKLLFLHDTEKIRAVKGGLSPIVQRNAAAGTASRICLRTEAAGTQHELMIGMAELRPENTFDAGIEVVHITMKYAS